MLNTRSGQNFNANDVINSNDLKKRILNVDSRFRSDQSSSATDYSYRLVHPYKNIIRIRVASVEIPNVFYTFTCKNNKFILKAYDINGILHSITITIKEGNYTSDQLIEYIQNELDIKVRDGFGIFMTITIDPINGKITFTHNGVSSIPVSTLTVPTVSAREFALDFCSCSCNVCTTRLKKSTYYGLGQNLGFFTKYVKATITKPSIYPPLQAYCIPAPGCLDVVGIPYMFLCVNDFYTVEQKTSDNYFQALAKVIIREDKYMVIYDDGGSFLSNEIIFTSPVDLSVLKVQLLDPYGDIVHLCGLNFTFSLEITEVLNTKLYDFYRNYIWLGGIPSVPPNVTGSAVPLLKGIGPPF
jgi:hypothetical protein